MKTHSKCLHFLINQTFTHCLTRADGLEVDGRERTGGWMLGSWPELPPVVPFTEMQKIQLQGGGDRHEESCGTPVHFENLIGHSDGVRVKAWFHSGTKHIKTSWAMLSFRYFEKNLPQMSLQCSQCWEWWHRLRCCSHDLEYGWTKRF